MSFGMNSSGHPAAEMNVTPLIDVLLVLLIIFMIITPMDPHGVFADVPQERGTAATPEATIGLQLAQG
jgi:biopolymer transport protein TolR